MVQNPPAGMAVVTPYLLYADLDAALDFATSVLGFTEEVRMPGPDGTSVHGEVTMGEGRVMMGVPGPDYRNPKAVGANTALTYVYVDDVDAHFAAAKAAGATIVNEPTDQFYGDRTYGVEDPEGHQWSFATHTRDVAPEDMHP